MQKHTHLQIKSSILSVLATNTEMDFGIKLKNWRKNKGLTQEELSIAVGVNVSYISNLERNFSASSKSGKPKASELLVEKIAKVLGINLDDAREAAGYSRLNAPSIPEELAITGFDGLDKEDLKDIAEFIEFKKAQKNKSKG